MSADLKQLNQDFMAKRQVILARIAADILATLSDLDRDDREHVLDLVREQFCTSCGEESNADGSCSSCS